MQRYAVIENSNLDKLVEEVNTKTKLGWIAQGGIMYLHAGSPMDSDFSPRYLQAMILNFLSVDEVLGKY
jgi:hypothetical protein